MPEQPMAQIIKSRLQKAAQMLGAQSPLPDLHKTIDRAFSLPEGDSRYARNNLTPGTVAFEPSYSEQDPQALRFTLEPLGPGSPPTARRDEATREMRRLVGTSFGGDALHWFDGRSEEWRSLFGNPRLNYGAWFGTAYDRSGLQTAKVYYELLPNQMETLPSSLLNMVKLVRDTLPSFVPVFTSIMCRREHGNQRVTFVQRGPLRVADLRPLMEQLGMVHQLPSVMQVVGLALGGRFDLPDQSVLLGMGGTEDRPELKLYVLLGMLPDLPPSFLHLLSLGLAERPRELRGLQRWLEAYTPDRYDLPGDFSVLSIRVTPQSPARVSLYLRPVEFEISRRLNSNDDESNTEGAE